MAWIFADSFDFYSTITDGGTHWDTTNAVAANLAAGRFTGSQAISNVFATLGLWATKTSASNDATHHIVCAFEQTVALSGTTLGAYIQFLDGTTAQCAIVFRSDGTILLTSGTPAGSILATYSSAFSASVWTAYEFAVTIDGSAGAIHVRKNGNTSDDFSATGLITALSGHNYANKIQLGLQSNSVPLNNVSLHRIDDLLWFNTGGAAPNTWVGDVRSYPLLPASDNTVQFTRSMASYNQTPYVSNTNQSRATGVTVYSPFTPSYSGTIATGNISINTGGTGNMKVALYDATRASVLATSNAVVNPTTGLNTITFASPPTVVKGTAYWLGVDQDFSCTYNLNNAGSAGFTGSTAYGSFPATSPGSLSAYSTSVYTLTITPTVNADMVNEPQQDGTTSYVYDSTVGHGDLYNIGALPTTPPYIVATQLRGYVEKSDAGSRLAQLQLKSGAAAAVYSTAFPLATSFQWISRVDTVDPNTGVAWTAVGVNGVLIGPYVNA